MKYVALFALFGLAIAATLSPADQLREDFYKLEQPLWKNVTDSNWSSNSVYGGDIELTRAFTKFADQLENIPRPPRLPLKNWLWNNAYEKILFIEDIYKNKFDPFVRRQAQPGIVPAPLRDWLDLAETILNDPKSSIRSATKTLEDLFAHGDMFRSILHLQEDHPDLCSLQLSPHQLVYDMYNTIALTEIKGYAMMQFSWMLLRIYGKGNYTQEAELTRQRYNERAAKTAAAARGALVMAKRDVYRCDPPEHQLGVTYEEVTRLLQGYIENEVDMNPQGTCKEDCAFYTMTENYGCFKNQYCAQQKTCNGRILECQYIDSDMWICPASPSSNRRYEWIEYENGRTLGRAGSCTRGVTKVDSWWRWNLLHCSYCMCLCEDSADSSERFFSMRESLADVNKNKVVTGIRLVKLGRVFHLQIHEGTLGERGKVTIGHETAYRLATGVADSAGGWAPLQEFDPADADVSAGVDFHTLSYEERGIDLDELHAPEGHVLTGVRFRMHGPHLHFDIRTTPFSFTTGHLAADKSKWISNDNTDGADQPRRKLTLVSPDIPTRARSPLPVDSAHDQYLEFTHSDFEADAAQSTVPFLDIQPVLPMKGAALASGAGVVHRGARGSGGLLALKLFTYDYSQHVRAEPPPAEPIEDHEDVDFVPMPAS